MHRLLLHLLLAGALLQRQLSQFQAVLELLLVVPSQASTESGATDQPRIGLMLYFDWHTALLLLHHHCITISPEPVMCDGT